MLAAYRKQHDISDELHHKTLLQIGWTDEDFERGSNHRGWVDSWFNGADRKREQPETSSMRSIFESRLDRTCFLTRAHLCSVNHNTKPATISDFSPSPSAQRVASLQWQAGLAIAVRSRRAGGFEWPIQSVCGIDLSGRLSTKTRACLAAALLCLRVVLSLASRFCAPP
jgi:hypothetical protein